MRSEKVREMIVKVTAIPGVKDDGNGDIGTIVELAMTTIPSITADEIAADIIEAQNDARSERANGY